MNRKYDAIVIGGGPAGSSAAAKIAEAGLDVLVVEKRREIGSPVQCAEFIQRAAFDGPKNAICQKISKMITRLPDGSCSAITSPGYTIHRDVYDKGLAEAAKNAGADYMLGSTAVVENGTVHVKNGSKRSFETRIAVDASGPSKKMKLARSFQYTMRLKRNDGNIHVWLRHDIPGGYAWLFPKGEVANVGIAAATPINLKKTLGEFINSIKDEFGLSGEPIRRTGGPIPVSGVAELVKGSTLYVGDAAGVTHPVSGEGTYRAVTTGRMAGEAVSQSILNDDMAMLMNYEREFENLYGLSMRRDIWRRDEWTAATCFGQPGLDDFRRLWIGFPEYYKVDNKP